MTTPTLDDKKIDDKKRWTALAVLCIGVLMIVLDTTIVNVAGDTWTRCSTGPSSSPVCHG